MKLITSDAYGGLKDAIERAEGLLVEWLQAASHLVFPVSPRGLRTAAPFHPAATVGNGRIGRCPAHPGEVYARSGVPKPEWNPQRSPAGSSGSPRFACGQRGSLGDRWRLPRVDVRCMH